MKKGVFKDLSTVLWSKVLKTEGCWLWQASRHDHGYGHLVHAGKDLKAHRVAWELTNGPIPEGMQVLHHCDNPPCVRPSHLFLGTRRDNEEKIESKECPRIGDVRQGKDLGYKSLRKAYIYIACPHCGAGKWMDRRNCQRGLHLLCRACAFKKSLPLRSGSKNYNWKGGRRKTRQGYIKVLLKPEDKFYQMADSSSCVLEHRLVMAQHLGRPLLRTEVVHHRPDVAKDDNKIEVLYLMPNPSDHSRLNPCSKCELKEEVRLLRWQIKQQMEQIRNLTTQLILDRREQGNECGSLLPNSN